MTAIETRFLGSTNYRGSRYKAIAMATGQTITVQADNRLDHIENHKAAVRALITKMAWLPGEGKRYGPWYMADGGPRGYVFVCALPDEQLEV